MTNEKLKEELKNDFIENIRQVKTEEFPISPAYPYDLTNVLFTRENSHDTSELLNLNSIEQVRTDRNPNQHQINSRLGNNSLRVPSIFVSNFNESNSNRIDHDSSFKDGTLLILNASKHGNVNKFEEENIFSSTMNINSATSVEKKLPYDMNWSGIETQTGTELIEVETDVKRQPKINKEKCICLNNNHKSTTSVDSIIQSCDCSNLEQIEEYDTSHLPPPPPFHYDNNYEIKVLVSLDANR